MWNMWLKSFLYIYLFCYSFWLFDEGVDVHAATKHGIKVAKIPSAKTGNASSCAEMAIYLMLGLLRKQVGPLELCILIY